MAVLRDAVARCPDDPALLAELVNIHALSGDLATALRVARESDAAFPGRMDIQERISQIEFRIAHAALDTAEQVTSPAVAVPARTEPAVVMSAFESLGAGCTFGYVQRSFGAEPMGLLRWGGMAFPDMLRALDDQFAHLAEDGNVALMASEMVHVPMGGREYIAIDQIYNLTSHTFIPVSDNEDVEKLRHAVVRKMRLLGRVLLSELRKGQKVFLYKDARRHLTEADVQALHDRIRRYGDSALLYVRPNPPDVGDYSLQARGDKLLFATLPEEYLVEHRVRENQPWLTLCTEVLRITA